MELESRELQFHLKRHYRTIKTQLQVWNSSSTQFFIIIYFYFLSLIGHNSIFYKSSISLKLDFKVIEYQNKGTPLYSLEIGAYCQIFCSIGAKGQNPPLCLPRIHMRTTGRTLFQRSCLPFNCYIAIREGSLGLQWQCFFSFSFTTFFFLSFLHFL